MVRFGAVLSKAKPYGAMWFGKNRYRRHRTVPAPSQSFDLKTLTPDPGYILVEFVPCDSVRIFMLGNPRGVCFGAVSLKANPYGTMRFGKTALNGTAP